MCNETQMIHTVTSVNGHHDTRCHGFFFGISDAKKAVEENHNDIHDDVDEYRYCVIESFTEGLGLRSKNEIWYEWIDGKYIKCDRPKEYNHLINFGMA